MSEPFIAEVRLLGFNFAPRGWAFCEGQLLPISQNTALFSLIGTTYGGDGRTTMGLPNFENRMPMHAGRGPGLTDTRLGQRQGAANITLGVTQMPAHTHTVAADNGDATLQDPTNEEVASAPVYHTTAGTENMASQTVRSEGGGQAHENKSPYLNVSFAIALVGLYPSRA